MVALDPRVVQELQLRHHLPLNVNQGILVFRMVQDSPADRSGMRPGDIITHINGSAITSSKDIYKFLEETGSLKMTIIRKGREIQLEVDLNS
jgi:S1-C subfamily serine protease